MAKPASSRFLALATATLLLVGQGTALHHVHESVADCLAGPCSEHDGHSRPAGAVSHDDACPLCEMRSEQRTAVGAPAAAPTPIAAPTAAVHARPEHPAGSALLAGRLARAPPARS